MRKIVFAVLCLVGISAWAEMTEGLIVRSGDVEKSFALSEIKELTFGDDALTVVKFDGLAVAFASDWSAIFGQVDLSGILVVATSDSDAPAQIFSADGRLMKSYDHISNMTIEDLPSGVYIIMCNGKSLKIKR